MGQSISVEGFRYVTTMGSEDVKRSAGAALACVLVQPAGIEATLMVYLDGNMSPQAPKQRKLH
jgi:hypothetical protein